MLVSRQAISEEILTCPTCGSSNPAGSNFCAQCGDSLQITCPVCSFVSPADAKFCSNCGNRLTSATVPQPGQDVTRYVPPEMLTKMTAARATNPMRGERRTVTMLFADIKGSTAAAESLDPEDWTDIINGAFEHLIEPVYRYEGTLARLLGDAVLAFFGAPIAHEDDPVRAVRAGLEIVEAMDGYKAEIADRWGIPIDVRVGINTGLVVVGEVGSDLRVEYTALGDAVNVAARMEQTADPGTVRVTSDTWSLVADHFQGEEIGPVEVKGKSEPVTAVRVVGWQRQTGPALQRVLIGRTEELGRLDALRERLMAGGGWVASIMGEAGLGKSCLLDRFRSATEAAVPIAFVHGAPGALAWMSSVNESYDASVPYSAVSQLLARWWELERADGAHGVVVERAEAVIPEFADAGAYLAYLTGVPLPEATSRFLERLEPPVLDARVRQAAIAYVEAEAQNRPLLISLEDIHWADPMSLALLDDLMGLTESVPLGVVFTMRPYRDEPPWTIHEAAERNHPHRYETIDLTSLGRSAAEELLDNHLDGLSLPAELRQQVLERSNGNPLFIEQMARTLREGGSDTTEFPVPTGLAALLTARLDRLEQESRTVAQIASVIGNEFERPTLAALVGDAVDLGGRLTDLLRREIFVERPGEVGMIAFHHALMREAAYSTMLLRTRRELHARLAEYLTATAPDSVHEIAVHFLEAGDRAKAFPHLIVAGERSSRSMALSDAIHFFTTALENIPPDADADLIVRGHDGLGVAYTLVPDLTQSEAAYQRLVDYADTSGRPSAKVTALNRLGIASATMAGDLPSAHRYLEQARALAEEAGDEFGLAQYHMNACTIAGLGGNIDETVFHDAETARWGKELGSDEIRIEGLIRLAENTVWLMDFDRAVPATEEALEAVEEVGDERRLALLRALVLSRLRLRAGDTEEALELMIGSQDTLDRYADFFSPLSQGLAGQLLYETGRIEEALTAFHKARTVAEERSLPFFVALNAAGLARVYATVGMDEAMGEARDAAEEAVRSPLGDFLASTVLTELGYAALARDDAATAATYFEEGLASSSAAKYWAKPQLLLGRALVAARSNDPVTATGAVAETAAFVEGKQVRAFDPSLEFVRGEVLLAEGDAEQAAASFARAEELAQAARYRVLAVTIAGAAVRASLAMGDSEGARRHVARARQQVAELAAGITDSDLKAAVTAWSEPLEQLVN
ncbi:MAG TPA: adenylate/guanylate cyclase domain-containing protein [Acidimicrobiia bacterium]|nr:adenylate/guanylate cyclase domain-containing protein [Acidimicrobiia bacterium]